MALSDDGEDDSELVPRPAAGAAGRKSRKEREDELRRMMEEDDDDDDVDEAEEKADTPMEDVEEPPEEVPEREPEVVKEEPAEVVSASSGDGRRRGKRRVMRKKQVMDEQGYLGKFHVSTADLNWELTHLQSPCRRSAGSLSLRMNRRLKPQSRRRHLQHRLLKPPSQRREEDPRGRRVISCPSSARSNRVEIDAS